MEYFAENIFKNALGPPVFTMAFWGGTIEVRVKKETGMDKGELKQRCLKAIDDHRDAIIGLGESAYGTPELGYKEFKTGKMVEEAFRSLGMEPETGIAYTGSRVTSGPKGHGPRVAVMGELDCVMCDSHPDASEGGLVHACGHHVQLANLLGAAVGILKSGVMEKLGGAADFIAIPSEECVDYDYRGRLIREGAIHYMGGKQELLYCGGLDDTDLVLQCHMMEMDPGKRCIIDTKCNGFISKSVHFIGKASHAGFAPDQGVNALNMAGLAMNHIHVLRETFRDEDKVRVSMVIKEGGGLVNVVPDRVTMEIMVRAFTIDAIEDASRKVNRALKAAAMVLGGKVEIHDSIGYLPLATDRSLGRLYKDNMIMYEHAGEDEFTEDWESAGSTDLGDISQLMPCMHIWAEGIRGGLHTKDYHLEDPYKAYIVPARMMALTIIDLLWDGGALGRRISESFKPAFTKSEYLEFLKEHQTVEVYDASGI